MVIIISQGRGSTAVAPAPDSWIRCQYRISGAFVQIAPNAVVRARGIRGSVGVARKLSVGD